MIKKALKILLFSFYFLLLVGVVGKLFFEEKFDRLASNISIYFTPEQEELLTIGYSEPLISMNPLGNDTGSRNRLAHIYETLTRVTPDLQIEPSLAISYGSLDDLTWEFRLRPAVIFHNGQPLTLDDVIFSLEEAKKNPSSGLTDLAASIEKITPLESGIFHITTEKPDPLLLQKLSYFPIFPRFFDKLRMTGDGALSGAIGTGPYRLQERMGETLSLHVNEAYWGKKPFFPTVSLITFRSKEEKIKSLRESTVDIVANVPPDTAKKFDFDGFYLKTLPSLEVNFLMFHFGKTFQDRRLREAVSLALRGEELSKLTQGFAVPVDQFVSNGIFGFDPSIQKREYDLKKAEELVKEVSGLARVKVTLDLPKGLDVFGAHVKDTLRRIGIDATLNFLPLAELSRKIVARESEFFFFGWRNDLGDAGDFLSAVIHSPSGSFGRFNGGNYRDSEVDRYLELAGETVKSGARLEYLRKVMKKITVEDIAGVPLFSPEVLYGVKKRLKFTPRVDGYILAQEVKM